MKSQLPGCHETWEETEPLPPPVVPELTKVIYVLQTVAGCASKQCYSVAIVVFKGFLECFGQK